MSKERYRRGAHTVTDFKYHFVWKTKYSYGVLNWGRHLWERGYFGATVGAVTEEQIKKYIEDQSDDPGSFKVWDEPEETEDD